MAIELNTPDLHAERWPSYRARHAITARRLTGPTWLDGRYHRDGYLVSDRKGRVSVVDVAAFEAVYELAGLYE